MLKKSKNRSGQEIVPQELLERFAESVTYTISSMVRVQGALEVVLSYLAVDSAVCWSLFVGILLDQGRPKIPANIYII